jgi:hypothetical protein
MDHSLHMVGMKVKCLSANSMRLASCQFIQKHLWDILHPADSLIDHSLHKVWMEVTRAHPTELN